MMISLMFTLLQNYIKTLPSSVNFESIDENNSSDPEDDSDDDKINDKGDGDVDDVGDDEANE